MKTRSLPLSLLRAPRGARSLPARVAAFNPALPVDGSLIVAGELRGQFNGLAALIAAVTSVNAAVVDGVTTLPPWEAAMAGVSVEGSTLHFTFGIPQGETGSQGEPGMPGEQGYPGEPGPQGEPGPPFAQAVVDEVSTLSAGDPAWVSVSFDGTYVHFSFGIPEGPTGEAGPPGEVTLGQLDGALATTSSNTNSVETLDTPYADPDAEQLRQKLNELILAARR